MREKGIGAATAIVIIIIAAVGAGGAYIILSGGEEGGEGGEGGIGEATSLSCKVDVTNETTTTATYQAKDIGSDDMKMRIEGTTAGTEFKYIINGEEQKAWMYAAGQWIEHDFGGTWEMWSSTFEEYETELSGWTGGDYEYTDPTTGYSIRIYDIQVNPTLPDSLFQPS